MSPFTMLILYQILVSLHWFSALLYSALALPKFKSTRDSRMYEKKTTKNADTSISGSRSMYMGGTLYTT